MTLPNWNDLKGRKLKPGVKKQIKNVLIRLIIAVLLSFPYFAAFVSVRELRMAQEEIARMSLELVSGDRTSRLVDLGELPEGTTPDLQALQTAESTDAADDAAASEARGADGAVLPEAAEVPAESTEAPAEEVFSDIVIGHVSDFAAGPGEDVDAENAAHKVYLTFDDGPSIYTDDILDILAEYGVKATFFVIGKDNPASYARYLRIVAEGHTLGMHSYTHVYSDVYASKEAFEEDTDKLRDMLEDVTGVRCTYYRFPGGSSNDASPVDMHVFAEVLKEKGLVYFDWNIQSGDASGKSLSAEQIAANALAGVESRETSVILLHDTASKKETVRALPIILEALREMEDTVVLPITEDTEIVRHIDFD